MNKIRIVSVLAVLSFLLLPVVILAQPVLPMSLYGTITLTGTGNTPIDTILKAYCGNSNTEIGTVTLTTAGQYGPQNTSLPVNNCQGANIWVQATFGSQVTEKQDTGLTFASTVMTEKNITFASSSAQPATPAAPSGLTATVDSQTAITLSWVDNSTNETGFAVYKDGVLLTTTAANATTYQATGLTTGTTYNFYVKAVNNTSYSSATSTVSATTLAAAVNADSTSGIVAGSLVNTTQAGYVNNSTTETVTKGTQASIIANITIVSSIQALSSISNSSANVVVGKQAINLGTASNAGTTSAAFNTNAQSTTAVVETTVFVPTDTTSSAAQKVAVVIPKLTLIKISATANLASVEIRPPAVQNSTVVENAIKSSFAQATAPVSVKAAFSVPASVSEVKFYAANGTTDQYIDICMDKSGFSASVTANDVQVYYSAYGTSWAIDSYAQNKAFVGNQFCFQTNHLSSFAGGEANSKSVACTQSGAPAHASYTVADVTVTWNGSAWSTPAACAWTCDSGYTQADGTCVTAAGGGGGGGGGGDTAAPSISQIKAATTATSVTITWKTNESSLSWLVYGTTTAYGEEEKTTSYVTSHSVTLSGLSFKTTYHYKVKSKDSAGNIGSYTDRTFTTLAEGEVPEEEVIKPVSEMTIAELKAEIVRIAALIAELQVELAKLIGAPTIEGCTITSFDRNLKQGMSGDDVKCLQIILNLSTDTNVAVSGVGSSGQETNYFGSLTKAAVIKFQEKYVSDILAPWNLTEGTGFVGSTTLDKLNTLLGQ